MINNADSARIINLLNTVSYWWYYLHIIYRADYKKSNINLLKLSILGQQRTLPTYIHKLKKKSNLGKCPHQTTNK